ncbi:MAG: hypothetical protein SGILL_005164 [Bacillariaceae sp.]
MKSFSLVLTAWLPLVSVSGFSPIAAPTSTAASTKLYSTTRGRSSARSARSSTGGSEGGGGGGRGGGGAPRGGGARREGGAPRSRPGRSRRGGGGGGARAQRGGPRDDAMGGGGGGAAGGGGGGGYSPGNMPGGHNSGGPNSMNGQSMNSQRSGRGQSRGGVNMNGAGADYDYSGGNLRYGTGKYQQRTNDGYSGGVNLSNNGHSMQHNVYTGGKDDRYGAYGRAYERTMMDDMMYEDDMMFGMEDEMMMMYDEFGEDMYMDDMMMGGGVMGSDRMGPRGGGGQFREGYSERSGRGGPRAFSSSRNGGYTTNGRSHQFNSRMDERRRYSDDYYYGDDEFYAQRGGMGDRPPERRPGPGYNGGGNAGLLRDEMY